MNGTYVEKNLKEDGSLNLYIANKYSGCLIGTNGWETVVKTNFNAFDD